MLLFIITLLSYIGGPRGPQCPALRARGPRRHGSPAGPGEAAAPWWGPDLTIA